MTHDITTTLRTTEQLARQMGNAGLAEIFDKAEKEIVALRAELAALKDAVRLLIITTQPVLGEDGHLWVTTHAVDALAALLGEG